MTNDDSPHGYRIGRADHECRYPVLVDEQQIGRIFRWHGGWLAIPAGTSEPIRRGDGRDGSDAVARYLLEEYRAGRITPQADTRKPDQGTGGRVPLLHPRMRDTDRNQNAARKAVAGLTAYRWEPRGGYPGADNPWAVRCQLCGWEGNRYWSHLRGRNGNPPSPYRHPGCIDADKVRAVIPAYADTQND
ncbi:hypothetical protein [Streptomyces katrae]|uniref:hypothetical protein n=1 Tax=Streptomyces katrae TaxID=68223 RepID=UPI00068E717C|nr:hypothetical protein [Streptomyces katrae]